MKRKIKKHNKICIIYSKAIQKIWGVFIDWVKYFLYKFDLYNWFRFRIWDKYHILRMRYLKPSYHDNDEILIHSMFEVLCRFIEDEDPAEIIVWNHDKQRKHTWAEMNALYNWWTKKRQKRHKEDPLFKPGVCTPELVFIPDKEGVNPVTSKKEQFSKVNLKHKSKKSKQRWEKACDDSSKWEEECDKEDQEMMIRLIKIRNFLWT